jgi:hypothetical protein
MNIFKGSLKPVNGGRFNGGFVSIVEGNSMNCVPPPFNATYNSDTTLPQCQVRTLTDWCHLRQLLWYSYLFLNCQCPVGFYWDVNDTDGCKQVSSSSFIILGFSWHPQPSLGERKKGIDITSSFAPPQCNQGPCPAGQQSCPAGSTSPSTCAKCEPGTYKPAGTSSMCLLCPKGKYQASYGMESCVSCPSTRMQVVAPLGFLILISCCIFGA